MARRTRRCPSDTSDEQWALIEPLLPEVRSGGRPEKHPRRDRVDAILYVVRAGCAWRAAQGRNLEPGAGLIDSQSVKGADTVGRESRGYDDGETALLWTYLATPVRFLFADGGFAGRLLDWAQMFLRTTIEIARKPAGQRGFAVIPRRWAVERSPAWLAAHRRLARDYERDPTVSEAMIRWATINTITRRLARGGPATPQQRRVLAPAG